ncbi:glucokinase [Solimonas marina]|uniref:Glucokinase n=1 Tax=Solimonas marina TaxID=2714601 RepID=A0A969WCU5_9GAMM|nr:glucokinase [Solimonas marina]NKF22485.1 glucokinase [Solimonas marina]
MMQASASVRLVADIGGTNARFALASPGAGRLELMAIEELQAAAFPTLADAARDYLSRRAEGSVAQAVFAVASPVTGDRIKITNNPWEFSVASLRDALALQVLDVINDFVAVAAAVPQLERADVQPLGCEAPALAREHTDGHFSVLGPGTGLGVAQLVLQGGRSIVLGTEGGHVSFAPTRPEHVELLKVLWREWPRVSAERLLSGAGLVALYRAVCVVAGWPADELTPAEVSARDAQGDDEAAARAVTLFCELLGAFAGDTALMQGGWGGVYLAGGITQKLLARIEASAFREHFEDKGRFRPLLRTVPTLAITHPHVGLLGAAARAFAAGRL